MIPASLAVPSASPLGSALSMADRLGRHADARACPGEATRERLGADVHHSDFSRRIDVAQLSGALGHAEIVDGVVGSAAADVLGLARSVFT